MAIDEKKLNDFMGKAVTDIGAAMSVVLFIVGEKLGLYKAMAGSGPLSPAEIAKKTGTQERNVKEWLLNQAAGGYVMYDPATKKFTLPDEQALALAEENSGAYLHGAYEIIASLFKDTQKIEKAFKGQEKLGWEDHDSGLFSGTERFFRPSYSSNLVGAWIPALEGVEAKLKAGARVADIGCGHGASTIIMAKAFPKSTFIGFDNHAPSIEAARKAAEKEGVSGNVSFAVASSTDYPGTDYDLVTFFDSLHDMGDPSGAAAHVASSLANDGTWMLVEPFAGDNPEENFNPVGRVFYAASASICVPGSLAYDGPALGAQAGEEALRKVVLGGGFKTFRRATQTPFNLVLEAKK